MFARSDTHHDSLVFTLSASTDDNDAIIRIALHIFELDDRTFLHVHVAQRLS